MNVIFDGSTRPGVLVLEVGPESSEWPLTLRFAGVTDDDAKLARQEIQRIIYERDHLKSRLAEAERQARRLVAALEAP